MTSPVGSSVPGDTEKGGPWSVHTQQNDAGTSREHTGIYFAYKGSVMGRFSGSLTNAEWMVLCINAAHAAYLPMADAIAREGGFADMAAAWDATERGATA